MSTQCECSVAAAMDQDGSGSSGNDSPAPENMNRGPRIYRFMDSVKKTLYVMGSALLVFAAARNSFHWYIHRIWGATGSFWQSCWDHIYQRLGQDNDFMFCFLSIVIVSNCVFWLGNAFFISLDLFGVPQIAQKYKIQENVQMEIPKFRRTVFLTLFNSFVIGIPFSACVTWLYLWRGCSIGGEMPTFHWVIFEMLVFSLVEEFGFYYSHRLFHHPLFYKRIHKIHHEWTAPIGLTAIYAHPIEYLIANVGPPALGPLIMGSHLATALLWFSVALLSTTISHCGYHLPFLPSPEAHDYHHLKFNQNYGVLGVLDRLHGTDVQFRTSKQYTRHMMLMNTVPISQQYPDEPKKKSQ